MLVPGCSSESDSVRAGVDLRCLVSHESCTGILRVGGVGCGVCRSLLALMDHVLWVVLLRHTRLSDAALGRMTSVLQARALPSKDRAGAVADAFSLASAGKVGMDVALSLAMAVKDDPDNLVRSVVVSCLMDLLRLYSEVRPKLSQERMS